MIGCWQCVRAKWETPERRAGGVTVTRVRACRHMVSSAQSSGSARLASLPPRTPSRHSAVYPDNRHSARRRERLPSRGFATRRSIDRLSRRWPEQSEGGGCTAGEGWGTTNKGQQHQEQAPTQTGRAHRRHPAPAMQTRTRPLGVSFLFLGILDDEIRDSDWPRINEILKLSY